MTGAITYVCRHEIIFGDDNWGSPKFKLPYKSLTGHITDLLAPKWTLWYIYCLNDLRVSKVAIKLHFLDNLMCRPLKRFNMVLLQNIDNRWWIRYSDIAFNLLRTWSYLYRSRKQLKKKLNIYDIHTQAVTVSTIKIFKQ